MIIKNINPALNIDELKNDFNWEYPKINNILTDINKIKNIQLFSNNQKYNVNVDIKIFAGVWSALNTVLKNESLITDSFSKTYTEITNFKNIDDIVFDPIKAKNSMFTTTLNKGEVLRWSNLKKTPVIKKGDFIKYVLRRGDIEVIINCIASQDGFENEKMKVKLANGKELSGILEMKTV